MPGKCKVLSLIPGVTHTKKVFLFISQCAHILKNVHFLKQCRFRVRQSNEQGDIYTYVYYKEKSCKSQYKRTGRTVYLILKAAIKAELEASRRMKFPIFFMCMIDFSWILKSVNCYEISLPLAWLFLSCDSYRHGYFNLLSTSVNP